MIILFLLIYLILQIHIYLIFLNNHVLFIKLIILFLVLHNYYILKKNNS